jgi:hypothetical protein
MSHYEFLTKVLAIDEKICCVGEPFVYDDGSFSVEVTDSEDWAGFIILFDKDGNFVDWG